MDKPGIGTQKRKLRPQPAPVGAWAPAVLERSTTNSRPSQGLQSWVAVCEIRIDAKRVLRNHKTQAWEACFILFPCRSGGKPVPRATRAPIGWTQVPLAVCSVLAGEKNRRMFQGFSGLPSTTFIVISLKSYASIFEVVYFAMMVLRLFGPGVSCFLCFFNEVRHMLRGRSFSFFRMK